MPINTKFSDLIDRDRLEKEIREQKSLQEMMGLSLLRYERGQSERRPPLRVPLQLTRADSFEEFEKLDQAVRLLEVHDADGEISIPQRMLYDLLDRGEEDRKKRDAARGKAEMLERQLMNTQWDLGQYKQIAMVLLNKLGGQARMDPEDKMFSPSDYTVLNFTDLETGDEILTLQKKERNEER